MTIGRLGLIELRLLASAESLLHHFDTAFHFITARGTTTTEKKISHFTNALDIELWSGICFVTVIKFDVVIKSIFYSYCSD